MDVTRQEIRDNRHPACGWTEVDLDAAIEARFPATDPIDFAALCTSWANDQALGIGTLQQCLLIACAIGASKDPQGFQRPRGALFDPRGALLAIAAQYPAVP